MAMFVAASQVLEPVLERARSANGGGHGMRSGTAGALKQFDE